VPEIKKWEENLKKRRRKEELKEEVTRPSI
jgi:hypothetical protein